MKLLGVSGSLRKDSYNTRLLELVRASLPENIEFQLYTCTKLPLYNQDQDGDEKPAAVVELLQLITSADGLLISTPEYNFGIPGVLKNAIDWASRPAFNSVLKDQPTAIMSASMSALGGIRAQIQLKQVLGSTLTPIYPAPDFFVPTAHQVFKDAQHPADEDLQERVRKFLRGYISWVQNHSV
jgi:chromate reductase